MKHDLPGPFIRSCYLTGLRSNFQIDLLGSKCIGENGVTWPLLHNTKILKEISGVFTNFSMGRGLTIIFFCLRRAKKTIWVLFDSVVINHFLQACKVAKQPQYPGLVGQGGGVSCPGGMEH